MGRIGFRVVLAALVVSLGVAQWSAAAPGSALRDPEALRVRGASVPPASFPSAGQEREAGVRSLAYVHQRVREKAQEVGEARVIVVMGDPALPQAWARDWRQRGQAIQELARRVRREAPGFKVGRQYEMFPFLAGTADRRALQELAASPNVEAVYPDRQYRAVLSESGPLIGQPTAETGGHDGAGIGIAILDTGIDYTHPDLGASATVNDFPNSKVVGGYDIINSDNRPMDDFGHGTYVAGIAAGTGSTYRGIAPGASLVAVKVLNQYGIGYASQVIAGIQWCVTNKATYNINVVNLSLSDGAEWRIPEDCDADPEGQAISTAFDNGIAVVAAAGNEGYTRGIGLPGCASKAIAVGATWDAGAEVDTPAYFSNRGELLGVYAPGIWITSAKLSGGYETGAGTSSATPHVAGAVAVLAQMGVTTPSAVLARLARTGVQIVDPVTGVATPRIDLVRAVNDQPTSGPDLVVTQVTSNKSSALVGSALDLSLTVTNQGDAASVACQAVIGLSKNQVASPQDLIMATVDVPALELGQSYASGTVSGTAPGTTPGSYWVTAFVDAGYSVTEKNEINNGLRGSSFALEALNASVQSTAIPASMLKGQTYSITMTMKNESDAAWTAADGYALVAVSPQGNDRWGVTQRSLPVSSVASKATVTFTFDVTAPALAGLYPCHWQMARGGQPFGEIATGANKVRVFDEAAWGQNYPAVSGNYVAYEDYSGLTGSAVSVSNLATGGNVTLPDDIPFPRDSGPLYAPLPPYQDFDISYQWFPDISGPWVTWMVDDYPAGDWFFQITAQNVTALSVLPLRITYRNSDALFPSVDGKYVVWEDYRNDPDGTVGFNFLDDNPDIYISDISDVEGPNDHFPPSYALCTSAGPQLVPRISYPYVVWEDWRDTSGFQSDIYLYDLTVDSDGDGIPNWKETIKPSPDPAEIQLTDTYWPEEFPDIQGTNVVWMDFRRDSGLGEIVDLYLADIAVPTPTAVATEPPTFRYHPRIQGTKVVWEDWRQGQPDIYWAELNSGAAGPIAATGSREEWPDISGDRVVYAKHRTTVQYDDGTGNLFDWDVYNIWTQGMLKDGSVAACTFSDVPGTFWAWERIEDCVGSGIASGYNDGNFHPDWTVNRDQMAVFLVRALGEEPANPKDPLSWKSAYGYDPADPSTWEVNFSDVPATGYGTDGTAPYWAWYHIQRLYHTGVTKGVTATEFAPTREVLRDQMAAFLVRALGLECANPCVDAGCWPYDPANPATWAQEFADVPATGQDTCHGAYWAWFHIQAMFDTGITRGCGDGTSYCPEDPVRRDQMAVFLAKAFVQ